MSILVGRERVVIVKKIKNKTLLLLLKPFDRTVIVIMVE
jgi:hypothetical protein